MVSNIKKYFVLLFVALIVLFALHFLIYRAFLSNIGLSLQVLIEMYFFLAVLSVVHFVAITWLFKKWPIYAGLIFTGLSLLKMAICVLYLFPYIFPSNDSSIVIALSFMFAYFILLGIEVVFISRNMVKNH